MFERLARALHLRPHEAHRALALAGIVFALTCSYTLVKTARDALFLARLPATSLPAVFLLVGIVTAFAAAVYERTTRGRAAWTTLETAAWASALALVAFAWFFRIGAEWVPIAFYVWVNAYGLILMSQFWTYVGGVSDPAEAKRIYGVIGTGAILGGLAGGALAPGLVHALGIGGLTTVAAAVAAVAAPAVRLGPRALGAPAPEVAADADGPAHPLRHPYVRWLAVAALCSVLVTTLLDYQFKVEIQRRDATPEGLATFLGLFYTVTNLAALTIQLFLSRWLLQHAGAGWSAAVLPVGLLVSTAATLIAPGFATVVTTRLWDQVARLSVNKTAVQLFYFPLAPGVRRRARAWIDAGLERMGDALAGLLLIVLGAAMALTIWTLALSVAVLLVLWIAAWLGVRRGYVAELGRNLRRLSPVTHDTGVSLRESSLLQEMARMLESPYERVVLRGIEMLEDADPERIEAQVPVLLAHPSAQVRARALTFAERRHIEGIDDLIEARMRDPDPEVRIAAMRARCARGVGDPFEALEEFLEAGEPAVRRSALHCLAEFAPPAREGALRAVFERLLKSADPAERAAVADALGVRPTESGLHDLFAALLDDRSSAVRNAGLRAAGRARRRTLIPVLIERLADRRAQAAARAGLVAFGDHVVGTLGDYLSDASVAIAVRRELPRVLGEIGTAEAVAAIFRCRERADVRLAYRLLKAANRIRRRDPRLRFPADLVTDDIAFDAQSYLFALVHYRSCPIGNSKTAERLLCIALNERMDQALNRVFRRLALLYAPEEIHASYRGVLSSAPSARGNALEFLEHALSPAHAALVLPLVDDTGDDGRLRLAEERHGLRFVGFLETLEEILKGDDAWLRTCALYVAGSRREQRLRALVEEGLVARDPIVRETAAWAAVAVAGG